MGRPATAKAIRDYHRLLEQMSPKLVVKCCRCGKLRETDLMSDPLLLLCQWECSQIGWNCGSQEIVDEDVSPSPPAYWPGSFVLAKRADGSYFPGMIDFFPNEHPKYTKEIEIRGDDGQVTGSDLKFNVSLLNDREEEYGSELCRVVEVFPLEEAHESKFNTDETRRKFQICMKMRLTDVRQRLYKFSHMAHTNNLESPYEEVPRFVPVRHGSLNAVNLLAPGTSSARRSSLPDANARRPQPQAPPPKIRRPSIPRAPIPPSSAAQQPEEEQPPQQPEVAHDAANLLAPAPSSRPDGPVRRLQPQVPRRRIPQSPVPQASATQQSAEEEQPPQQPAAENVLLPPAREYYVEIRPDLRALQEGVQVRHVMIPYSGPPIGTPEAVTYLAGLAQRTGLNITVCPVKKNPTNLS